jgi:hypothetical protein
MMVAYTGGKVLKTLACTYEDSPVVVKVYLKKDVVGHLLSSIDTSMEL